jgi:adenylate cyclase
MNRGAFDFITKPVDLGDLAITVRKTLDDIARIRELEAAPAAAERARRNLARYFSPNLVGLLADRDEPLGPVRRRPSPCWFVDIVGFTRMAEGHAARGGRDPAARASTAMAARIFACGGIIEKYSATRSCAVFGPARCQPCTMR